MYYISGWYVDRRKCLATLAVRHDADSLLMPVSGLRLEMLPAGIFVIFS